MMTKYQFPKMLLFIQLIRVSKMNFLRRNFYLTIFMVCLLTSILLYQSSLNYYFFQDDFFEIGSARASNFWEYLSFYTFRSDIVDWRPISQLNYFFFLKNLFGLNPIGYRIVSYVLFFITALLIAKVVGKIAKSPRSGLLCASIWTVSSVHFMNLTWISASYNIVGTFFFLLTSLFFLKHMESKSKIHYFLAIVGFLLALGSFEFALTWPLLFILYSVLILKNSFPVALKTFMPFIAICSIYLILRFSFMDVPKIPEYAVSFNFESIKTLFWYLLWSFNIPEEFKKQIVDNLIVFNHRFLQDYYPLVLKTFTGLALVLILGVAFPLTVLIRRKITPNIQTVTFFVSWFLITIMPVLLIPKHTFIMYLSLSSIGLYAVIATLLISLKNKMLVLGFLLIWLWVSTTTLSFYKQNFWMIEAQKFAAKFTLNIKKQLSVLPEGSIVIYPLNDHREIQSLQGSDSLNLIYGHKDLRIFYNKQAMLEEYEKIKGRPIYLYIP